MSFSIVKVTHFCCVGGDNGGHCCGDFRRMEQYHGTLLPSVSLLGGDRPCSQSLSSGVQKFEDGGK